jgi:hypothetical protein
MSSLIMLLHAGVAWPVSSSERRGGLPLITSGIQGEAVFASGPTPVCRGSGNGKRTAAVTALLANLRGTDVRQVVHD